MINLPDVTLLAVSSVEIPATIEAIERSCEGINFGAVKLITHEKPEGLSDDIEYAYMPKMTDIMQFNHLAFEDLGQYVNTSHALLIQHHGYVLRPELFRDKWLEYDYCGAPWRWSLDAYICHETGEHIRVGNGGFSLRSKKLMDIPKKYNIPLIHENFYYNEDGNIAVYNRVKFLELGVKYMPLEDACVFSYENDVPENINIKEFFGFHRNIPRR